MTLLTLKNFIAKHKIVNISQLLQQFGNHQKEIFAWLELLIQKGYVRRCERKSACGTKCFKCQPVLINSYEWIKPAKN